MANKFGGFVHRSPLSSHPHDPSLELSSNCIRDHFGPTVQTVWDCLASLGGKCSLPVIIQRIRTLCKRDINDDREMLVRRLETLSSKQKQNQNNDIRALFLDGIAPRGKKTSSGTSSLLNHARGPELSGFVVDAAPIRAALIVLLQHSLIHVHVIRPPPPKPDDDIATKVKPNSYLYSLDVERARLLPRYPRYVEHARRAVDDAAASIIEEVLVRGRMRAEDLAKAAMEATIGRETAIAEEAAAVAAEENEEEEEQEDAQNVELGDDRKMEIRNTILKALKALVERGYLEQIPPIEPALDGTNKSTEDDPDAGETEFDDDLVGGKRKVAADDNNHSSNKKRRIDDDDDENDANEEKETKPKFIQDLLPPGTEPDSPQILSFLRSDSNRRIFPVGSVWRANVRMFHGAIRALALGRLVHERYGDKVKGSGAIISAALKLMAHRENAPNPMAATMNEEERQRALEERGCFVPDQIMDYLPPPILHDLKSRAGGARSNLSSALVSMSRFTWPQIIMEVEEARGHPMGGKFEVAVRQIVGHLKGRVLHQVVTDRHGEVAARICSILESKGHLEADAVAESAMVPAKDVREILHNLYRNKYISLLNLQQNKQHNPSNAIYLWSVVKSNFTRTVTDNIATALVNLRLRRQHEMELGRDWIERAKEGSEADENDHETDRANYNKFCQGLERLDNAMVQLDETLMVLKDF